MSENVLDKILGKRPEGSIDGPRTGVRPSASATTATARSEPRGERSPVEATQSPHAPSFLHDPHSPHDPDAFEDLGAFGWLRGVKERSLMLELRLRSGQILAVGYAWVDAIDIDPSDGITMHVSGRTIRILGRNLNAEVRPGVRLFHGLTKHRVPWIQEADHATIVSAPPHAAVVERIEW